MRANSKYTGSYEGTVSDELTYLQTKGLVSDGKQKAPWHDWKDQEEETAPGNQEKKTAKEIEQ